MGDGAGHGRALYFTRSTLYGDAPVWRHIGLYGYRRAALERFCAAPPSPLERREKLEQLRALEMGLSDLGRRDRRGPAVGRQSGRSGQAARRVGLEVRPFSSSPDAAR